MSIPLSHFLKHLVDPMGSDFMDYINGLSLSFCYSTGSNGVAGSKFRKQRLKYYCHSSFYISKFEMAENMKPGFEKNYKR